MRRQNPALCGFHPDPSLLRVGEDYYIATSTFEWFPGVCIHHSKDLVNWEIVGYALTDDEKMDMTGIDAACGIWAPNLTWCDGTFYLCYTIVYTNRSRHKDTHNFLVTAKSAAGPWSDPIPMNTSGFDPSLFRDADGRKYFVNMTMDYRPDRNRFSGIDVQEYDEEKGCLVGSPVRVFRGTERGSTEGPNIFRRGEWYYLVCAEGGTGFGHCATVVRSRSVWGPYEEADASLLLTSVDNDGCSLKRAGHAQLIEAVDGNWYMAHLCSRPIDDCSILGRETAIQNIVWTEDGWPKLAMSDHAAPSDFYEVPDAALLPAKTHYFDDYAKLTAIPPEFMTLRRSFKTNGIAIVKAEGAAAGSASAIGSADSVNAIVSADAVNEGAKGTVLRIRGGNSLFSKYRQGLLARRQEAFCCDFTAKMRFAPKHMNHIAGLIAYYNYDNFFQLRMTRDEEGAYLDLHEVENGAITDTGRLDVPEGCDTVWMKAEIREREIRMFASLDGEHFLQVGRTGDMRHISDEYIEGNGFTGSMLGISCADIQGDGCHADFFFTEYTEYPAQG